MAFSLMARDDLDVFYLVCDPDTEPQRVQNVYSAFRYRSSAFSRCLRQGMKSLSTGSMSELSSREWLHTFGFIHALLHLPSIPLGGDYKFYEWFSEDSRALMDSDGNPVLLHQAAAIVESKTQVLKFDNDDMKSVLKSIPERSIVHLVAVNHSLQDSKSTRDDDPFDAFLA